MDSYQLIVGVERFKIYFKEASVSHFKNIQCSSAHKKPTLVEAGGTALYVLKCEKLLIK